MVLAAIGQICSTASMAHNLSQCQALVRKAAAAGAKALFLPEASDYIAPNAAASLKLCQPLTTSPFVTGLQDSARTHSLPISVGIHTPAHDSNPPRIRNTLIWISATGDITHQYHKLHLFDVSIANGPNLQESASVERGDSLAQPFSSPLGNIGPLICFDLRFPEPAIALRNRGAQILTYPSAFTVPTGRAGHWEILLRARAIESQCWVIAAAQVGEHDESGKRKSYGHGMVVDPWGKVVRRLGGYGNEDGGEQSLDMGEICVVDVDLDALEKVRREMPLLRRTEVYPEML